MRENAHEKISEDISENKTKTKALNFLVHLRYNYFDKSEHVHHKRTRLFEHSERAKQDSFSNRCPHAYLKGVILQHFAFVFKQSSNAV